MGGVKVMVDVVCGVCVWVGVDQCCGQSRSRRQIPFDMFLFRTGFRIGHFSHGDFCRAVHHVFTHLYCHRELF